MELSIHVKINNHIATLEWNGSASNDLLEEAIRVATEDTIGKHGVHRMQVSIPAGDSATRRALQRNGFRFEGIKRSAWEIRDGEYGDVACFSRLATDEVGTRIGNTEVLNSLLPKKRICGHVIFRNNAGEVLTCETNYSDGYILPGGVVERGESPWQAAVREVTEELGIDCVPGDLLVADWLPPFLGWEDAVDFVYDGGVLTEAQIAQLKPADEVRNYHWLRLDEVATKMAPGWAERTAQALSGADRRYLEAGKPNSAH